MYVFSRFKSVLPVSFVRNILLSVVSLGLLVGLISSARADVKILVIGSSASFSDGNEAGVVQEEAFDPTDIAAELQSILTNDPAITGSVQVVAEDIYTTKPLDTAIGGSGSTWNFDYYRYSLMQYFMWPEGKTGRLANLRGTGTNWNYVVIMGDPYLMANMPGVFAEGVRLVASEVSSGTAEPILLAQWPENSSTYTASNFNEVVYRVGDSAGVRVVPAGMAWDSCTIQDSSANHPTPRGAYLAAASIYGELFARSATNSSYVYSSTAITTNIADHSLSVVQAHQGNSQYSGTYTNISPFQMKYLKKRLVSFNDYGSSTEDGFRNGLINSLTTSKIGYQVRSGSVGDPLDFSYSRGSDIFEPEKQYDYSDFLDRDNWTYGFPMGDHSSTGPLSMLYGIDKRYNTGQGWGSDANGTDLGVAYSMIREGQLPLDVRGIPVRLIWAKMNHADLGLSSHRDGWHLSNELDRGVGAFMYTLLSGRCPIGEEPSPVGSTDWNYWFCRKLGYETAWQMSHLTARAPGFSVLPTSSTATNVTPDASQTLSVQFMMAPTSDVTVAVSPSNPLYGKASPAFLTFTPANYSNAQTVTVLGETGAAGTYAFDILLTTSSDDVVYDGVSDAWDFSNTRPDGPPPGSIRILGNGAVIAPDDDTPSFADHTDFGVPGIATSRVFTIENMSTTQSVTLTSSPRVALNDASGYFSLIQDAAATLSPEASTTFEIEYDPSTSGAHAATVSVASTDGNLPLYSFSIAGARASQPAAGTPTASGVSSTSLLLSGVLTDGQIGDVWICWGEDDGGTGVTGSWENAVNIGSVYQDEPFSTVANSLLYGILYECRIYVTNDVGDDWSGLGSFGIPFAYVSSGISVANVAVTNVDTTSAFVSGTLDANDSLFDVYLYYSTNVILTASEWENATGLQSVFVGSYTNVDSHSITQSVSSLFDDTDYYCTFMATNELTNIWGATSLQFTTESALVPNGLIATPADGRVDLSWGTVSNALSYKVKRSTAPGGPYTTVATPTGTNYADMGVANGMTYYYVVAAVDGGGDGPDSDEVQAVLLYALPFSENFESLTVGDLNGQRAWVASNAVVQTDIALDSQAGSITNETGSVEHDFWGGQSNVWTDFKLQPVLFSEYQPAPPYADASSAFYFMTNGHAVVFDGTNSLELTSVNISSGAWVRLTVEGDYAAKTWNFYVDGTQVATNLGFYNVAVASYETFRLKGGSADAGFLDDLTIGMVSPFEVLGIAAPTGLTAYAVSGFEIALGWFDNSTNETGFSVERSQTSGANFTEVASVASGSTNYSDISCTPGSNYYYRILATNAVESSVASSEASAMTPLSTSSYDVPYSWLSDVGVSSNFAFAVTNDADGDGLSTWEEYWSGTDPTNAASYLRIDDISFGPTNMNIVWQHARIGSAAPSICIQTRTSLTSGAWSFAGVTSVTNGVNYWQGLAGQTLYYRLCVTNAP